MAQDAERTPERLQPGVGRLSTPGGGDDRSRPGLRRPMDVMLAAILGVVLYLFSGLRVLREYERAVYFFLGRSWGAKGPGLIYLPPLFAKMQKVSLRVVAMDVPPQDVITRDNISIKVTAVLRSEEHTSELQSP